jgi:hypothetical protein
MVFYDRIQRMLQGGLKLVKLEFYKKAKFNHKFNEKLGKLKQKK